MFPWAGVPLAVSWAEVGGVWRCFGFSCRVVRKGENDALGECRNKGSRLDSQCFGLMTQAPTRATANGKKEKEREKKKSNRTMDRQSVCRGYGGD